MEKNHLHLVVVSPERTLFDGIVKSVELPGEKGRFQVLFNHAAIISSLLPGNIAYDTVEAKSQTNTQTISIAGGFVEVKDNLVSVCVEL